ncbi:MAG: hypothetical protein MJD61_19840 [Proteobacteria bacterium]|nr:hypothetical protein [Pseudomonadota bacterium]
MTGSCSPGVSKREPRLDPDAQWSPRGPRTKAFHECRKALRVVAGIAVGCAFAHRSAQAPGGGELAADRVRGLVRSLDKALGVS